MRVIEERATTHGDFDMNAHTIQQLKTVLHQLPHWYGLPVVYKEAIEMIFVKISRAVCGDANEVDHWIDIQGYAKLAENYCRGSKPANGLYAQQETADYTGEDEFELDNGNT